VHGEGLSIGSPDDPAPHAYRLQGGSLHLQGPLVLLGGGVLAVYGDGEQGGLLKLAGDRSAEVQDHADAGRIIAAGPPDARIATAYDEIEDMTLVQAVRAVVPEPPSALAYPSSSTTGRYTVSWTEPDDAVSYDLQRSQDDGATWNDLYSGSTAGYRDMVEDGMYRYRVRAVGTGDPGEWRTGEHSCHVTLDAMEQWRRVQFSEPDNDHEAGLLADPNGDGFVNLLKFALRGHPFELDAKDIQPALHLNEEGSGPVFHFRVHHDHGTFHAESGGYEVGGILYRVMMKDDLATAEWTSWPLTPENALPGTDASGGPILQVHIEEWEQGTHVLLRLLVQTDMPE